MIIAELHNGLSSFSRACCEWPEIQREMNGHSWCSWLNLPPTVFEETAKFSDRTCIRIAAAGWFCKDASDGRNNRAELQAAVIALDILLTWIR